MILNGAHLRTVALVILLTQLTYVNGQYKAETLDLSSNTQKWYDSNLGVDKAGILLGTYYSVSNIAPNSHQFFLNQKWEVGTITYRNQVYPNISMLYDIEADILVIRHPTNLSYHSQAIQPIQEQVSHFEFAGHSFTNYDMPLDEGFYEDLVIGDSLVLLAKRVKLQRVDGSSFRYDPDDKYYLIYKNEVKQLRWRWDLMMTLKPYRKELKAYIRENNLRLKPNIGLGLKPLISYAEKLMTHE